MLALQAAALCRGAMLVLIPIVTAAEPKSAPVNPVPVPPSLEVLPAEEQRLPLQLDHFGPEARRPRAVISVAGETPPAADLVLASYAGGRPSGRLPLVWMGSKPWVARVDLPTDVDAVALLAGPEQHEVQRQSVPQTRTGDPWSAGRSRVLANPTREILLSGSDWKLGSFPMGTGESAQAFRTDGDLSAYRTVAVPGEIPLQMGLTGPDLYFQSRALTLINEREWWCRKTFRTPAEAKGAVTRLVFDGVDYYSNVWLNGEKLGDHEGMFARLPPSMSVVSCGPTAITCWW
jgi:Glycosyl hydrolases family 2, sugar binding domain